MAFYLKQLGPDDFNGELLALVIVALVLAGTRFVPPEAVPFLFCAFHAVTGWPCPSCGVTRALRAAGRMDWPLAFRFSPLGAVLAGASMVFAVYALIVLVYGTRRIRWKFHSRGQRIAIGVGIAAVVLANWCWLLIACAQGRWPPQ